MKITDIDFRFGGPLSNGGNLTAKPLPGKEDLHINFKLNSPKERLRFVSYVGYEMTLVKLTHYLEIPMDELHAIISGRPSREYLKFVKILGNDGFNPFWILHNLATWKNK